MKVGHFRLSTAGGLKVVETGLAIVIAEQARALLQRGYPAFVSRKDSLGTVTRCEVKVGRNSYVLHMSDGTEYGLREANNKTYNPFDSIIHALINSTKEKA